MSDLSVSDGKVTFTATADEQKTLIATIPYENGWTATVDGEKVEISSYQDAFILLPMAPGTHTVELTFVPNGMGIGVIISALGVFFSVALIVVTRKKHQERKAEEEIKLDREEDS
ncbi:MAG: YfhO family protein [Clostridiales bacterium]|nr:YfhO family protein [Clostridiales bacterium]